MHHRCEGGSSYSLSYTSFHLSDVGSRVSSYDKNKTEEWEIKDQRKKEATGIGILNWQTHKSPCLVGIVQLTGDLKVKFLCSADERFEPTPWQEKGGRGKEGSRHKICPFKFLSWLPTSSS